MLKICFPHVVYKVVENQHRVLLKIQKYPDNVIFEFDDLDELREFDKSYIDDTRSIIIKNIAKQLDVKESDMNSFTSIKDDTNESVGFKFIVNNTLYNYLFDSKELLYKGELKCSVVF